jgi:CheY-like chemotaxis protein
MKVLIVDDNQDILDLFKDLIGDQFTLVTAKNGQEALDLKDSDKDIVVVLTDIQMPVMDGYDLCRQIRKSDPLSVIIGFTAKYGLSTAFLARDVGFDDIFTKPIDPDEMINLVGQSFQKIKRWTAK